MIRQDLHEQLTTEAPKRLVELLAVSPELARVQRGHAAGQADIVVAIATRVFVVECKIRGDASSVIAPAVHSVKEAAAKFKPNAVPLIAVPYMGDVGKRLCESTGVSWLDLAGNAHIIVPGLRIEIQGRPNAFRRAGRPRSVFAPKSSRVARWLLMEPQRLFSQRELSSISGLDEGFTSRIVHELERQQMIQRQDQGRVKLADFWTMLEAWRDAYDFSRHRILRGHIAARSSDELLRQLSSQLKHGGIEHAATGLAGAWLVDQFAGFRRVVFYVRRIPPAENLRAMGFHEEQRGENVWLVVPNDEGVLQGATNREGITCAHPIQIYLDLKDHPERATEAAEQLRKRLLIEKNHG